MPASVIILAAGKGTRMQSELPKVLHPIAGAPMLVHAMKAAHAVSPERTIVVAGHKAELVEAAALAHDDTATIVVQSEQLGTGHAVLQAKDAMDGFDGDAIVLYGDTPFIRDETLVAMTEARQSHDIVVLGFNAADPAKYGRLITEGDTLEKIVEFKDASDEERKITLCNSGVICASAKQLFQMLDAVENDNASGEYYLTDIIEIGREMGLSATVVICEEAETLGVNSRVELAQAEALYQTRARTLAAEDGVMMMAPDTVFFSHDTAIGRDALIEQNVVFAPNVTVESGATIRAFSHLEGCHVARGAIVGPYARLRPGTELSENTKIGNFVELKNAVVDEGAKVNHLSYIGDAEVGAAANIGAGTITCNYDGVMKHKTKIGARAFIGSNTMLVAPVEVGDEAMTGSGSVVTKNVDDGDLAIARATQVNKSGMARRLFEKLKNIKKKRDEGAE